MKLGESEEQARQTCWSCVDLYLGQRRLPLGEIGRNAWERLMGTIDGCSIVERFIAL